MPWFKGNLITWQHVIWSQRSRDSRLSYGKDPESLFHLGLNRYVAVSDGRTEGHNYDS